MTVNKIPKAETLVLHWNFETVTSSSNSSDGQPTTSDAKFLVTDVSSGSQALINSYGWLGPIRGHLYPGRGDFFLPYETNVVDKQFINSARQQHPEIFNTANLVEIVNDDDLIFTRDTKPIKYFYAIERSIYSVVTEEMLKIFSTFKDFNNLIGEPVNRYRQEYKALEKLRQLFFSRIENTPDVEKYIEYFKWVDASLSQMIQQLIPASANFSPEIRTIIESHILERNKYWNKFPSLQYAHNPPEAPARGINELTYPWKEGSAPVSRLQTDNKYWWKERAERTNSQIITNKNGTNFSRVMILSASVSALNRNLGVPVRLLADPVIMLSGSFETPWNHPNNSQLRVISLFNKKDFTLPGTITNPQPAGNYHADYQVIQTSGRSINNRLIAKSGSAPFQITSTVIPGSLQFKVPDRSGVVNKFIFVERFSAPGGPEVNAEGALDLYAGEFAVNNDINLRNSGVRSVLKTQEQQHTAQFGLNPITGYPNYHKVNRNSQRRLMNSSSVIITGTIFDNEFIQHTIPQSDIQYAWVSASIDPLQPQPLGFNSDFNIPVGDSGSIPSPQVTLLTSSNLFSTKGIPVDFVGLNTLIYEDINLSGNILSSSNGTYYNNTLDQISSPNNTLNDLLIHRNGPYQFPSWKQLRVGETPVARKLRASNLISIQDPPIQLQISSSTDVFTIKNAAADTATNYQEPPVSFKNKPLVHYFDVNGSNQPLGIQHTYSNNLVAFANANINNRLGIFKCDNQMYDALKNFYVNTDLEAVDNPVKGFLKLTYAENIYPKDVNTGLAEIRGRTKYIESVPVSGAIVYGFYFLSSSQLLTTASVAIADYSVNGIDRQPIDRRTFWRNSTRDRNRWGVITNPNGSHTNIYDDTHGSGNPTTTLINSQGILDGDTPSIFPFGCNLAHTQSMKGTTGGSFMGAYGEFDFGELAPTRGNYGIAFTNFDGFYSNVEFANDKDWFYLQNYPVVGNGEGYYFFNFPTASALYTKQVNPDHLIFGSYYANGGSLFPNFQDDFDHRFRVNHFAGKNPWFDSYDEYSQDIRYMGKEYSIIPEFNISRNMNYYVLQQGGNFRKQNDNFLTNQGALLTQSALTTETTGFDENFFTIYSHSDFLKYFDLINNEHDNPDLGVSQITLTCKGIKKLLPYNGFYPVNRSLQLATLFSQSYAPFIGGTAWQRGQPLTASTSPASNPLSGNLAVAALLQPFFAPGIFYNTIKSGIAMDFPVVISSQGTPASTGQGANSVRYVNPPDYRISFESLLDIKNGGSVGGVPISSSDGTKKIHWLGGEYLNNVPAIHRDVYFDWTGEATSPLYSLAMHNFLAESINFFLSDGKLKSISSNPGNKIKNMTNNVTYYMDVRISRNKDFLMYGGRWNQYNKLFHTASIQYSPLGFPYSSAPDNIPFGVIVPEYAALSYSGKFFGHPFKWAADEGIFSTGIYAFGNNPASHLRTIIYDDAAYAPYLPPYWFGDSIARLSYTANGNEKNQTDIISSILSKISVQNVNDNLYNKMVFYNTGSTVFTDDRPAYTARSVVASSVNLFGIAKGQVLKYDPNSLDPVTGKAKPVESDDTDANSNSWIIYPKFECPILNYINQPEELYTVVFDNGETHAVTSPALGAHTTPPISGATYPIPKGMWSGYGEFCTGSNGVFFTIEESFPSLNRAQNPQTGSLIDIFGFNTAPQRLGEVATSKEISEAIVAIPFVDLPVTEDGFASTVKIMGRNFFKIKRELFDLQNSRKSNGQNAIQAGDFSSTVNILNTSISNLSMYMKKYIIPPELNFLKYNDIPPFVMYIFEFKHLLDQQDIADIWQGVMPKIGITAQKDEVEISHTMKPWEFFEGNKLPQKIRWMVFKVKKQASVNYFDQTNDSRNDGRFTFDFNIGEKIPDYSFNWPYDYCSLVELAKIEADIDISAKPATIDEPHLTNVSLANRETIEKFSIAPIKKINSTGQ